jgi:hypothetical protein
MVTIIVNPLDITGAPFTWHSGETWRIAYSFNYTGAGDVHVYLDIQYSNSSSAITKHMANEVLTLPYADSPTLKTSYLDMIIPNDLMIDLGTYDLILNVGGQTHREPGAIIIAAGSGNWVKDKTYESPDYSTYSGYVDQGTYGFNLGPSAIPFLDDAAVSIFTNSLISHAKANGSDVLSYTIYRDTGGIVNTPYQIDVTFKSPDQSSSSALSLGVSPQSVLSDTLIIGFIAAVLVAAAVLIPALAPVALVGLIGVLVFTVIAGFHWFFTGTAVGKAIGGAFDLLGSLIPLIIVMVIMKMMMESQQPAGTKKPVTEAVVKGGKAIGKGVVAVGKAVVPVVTGAIGTAIGGPVGGVVGGAAGSVASNVGGAVADTVINQTPD